MWISPRIVCNEIGIIIAKQIITYNNYNNYNNEQIITYNNYNNYNNETDYYI